MAEVQSDLSGDYGHGAKVVAQEPVMQFVAADWLKSNKREDCLASRPSNPVQLFLASQVNILSLETQDSFVMTSWTATYFSVLLISFVTPVLQPISPSTF